MKTLITGIMALSAALGLSAATVTTRCGKLSFTGITPDADTVKIDFDRCMANKLFTFSNVNLNGKDVNTTGSDNIGPFLIASGWTGGNHTNPGPDGRELASARTESVEVWLDGKPVELDRCSEYSGDTLTVKVVNTLFMPADTTRTFASETMVYTVAGGSIDVQAEHHYTSGEPQRVLRYYGMQSMFIGETEILTPGGKYSAWTPVAEVDRFTKASAPAFTTFIEHSPVGYQSSWMDPDCGLGNRALVADDDVVFIGNSYSKSYHKLIGDQIIPDGATTRWHGVYSWFSKLK